MLRLQKPEKRAKAPAKPIARRSNGKGKRTPSRRPAALERLDAHVAKHGKIKIAWRSNQPRKATRIRRRRTLAAVRAERKAEGPGVDPWAWDYILRWYGGCAYCEPGECRGRIVQDHVKPLSRGGRHEPGNVVPACEKANMRKGSATWIPRRAHPFPSGGAA